jgi:hypothetical protein
MLTAAQFADAFAVVDTETTRIGNLVIDLASQIKGGGLTEAEEQAAFDRLVAAGENLKKIAADPGNPVPVPTEPEPTPGTEPTPTPGEEPTVG